MNIMTVKRFQYFGISGFVMAAQLSSVAFSQEIKSFPVTKEVCEMLNVNRAAELKKLQAKQDKEVAAFNTKVTLSAPKTKAQIQKVYNAMNAILTDNSEATVAIKKYQKMYSDLKSEMSDPQFTEEHRNTFLAALDAQFRGKIVNPMIQALDKAFDNVGLRGAQIQQSDHIELYDRNDAPFANKEARQLVHMFVKVEEGEVTILSQNFIDDAVVEFKTNPLTGKTTDPKPMISAPVKFDDELKATCQAVSAIIAPASEKVQSETKIPAHK